ncbi:MAG: DNA-3-methyladenine glycosylase [Ktedonobacterales bacterium]|jgi:DNA-3-methyladenine glycosylase
MGKREPGSAPLPRAFYDRPTLEVARELIGKTLLRRTGEGVAGGLIVETEAYVSAIDPSAHGFRGQTPRNRSMFGEPGHAYVYRSYGIHFCLNVVTEGEGVAAAVLIRAIRPLVGVELMRARRGERIAERDLARGPGRLCQALALTLADDGADLLGPSLWLAETPAMEAALPIAATPRVGIAQAAEWPWRFVVAGDPFVSARGVKGQAPGG